MSPTSDDSEMAAKDILPNDIVLCEIDCEYTIPPNQELTAGSEKSISTRKIPTEIRRKFPWQKKSPLTCCNNLSIPGLNEDSKMEEECEQLPKLCARPNFVTAVSFRQDESEGLDDDDDVCAICLNGYSKFLESLWMQYVFGRTVMSNTQCQNLQKMERPLFLRNIATIYSTKTVFSSGLITTTTVRAAESIW